MKEETNEKDFVGPCRSVGGFVDLGFACVGDARRRRCNRRIGHQGDPAIRVATKKKKTSQTKSAAKTCPEGQELGARTGKCRPPTSEEK
jgi:hypothetical protein